MTDDVAPEALATFETLEYAIHAHFKQLWDSNNALEDGDYIGDWAIVAHYGNLTSTARSSGYTVETSTKLAPHALRGLLAEAEIWLDDELAGNDDE